MFFNNKYSRWYDNIVKHRRDNPPVEYSEVHHIIPRSIGGSNAKVNLVSLTAREHYLCHWLLTRMVVAKKHRQKMWNAFWRMNNKSPERSSVAYEAARIKHSEYMKEYSALKSMSFKGENNPMFGKLRPDLARRNSERKWTPEQRDSMSKKQTGHSYNKGIPKSESHKRKISEAKIDNTSYHWVNKDNREFIGTKKELCEFDQSVRYQDLTQVITGRYRHRGWTVYSWSFSTVT